MIGFLDTPSGISGDMFLGCLVDGGWPIERLRDTLERLGLPGGSWDVQATHVLRGRLRARRPPDGHALEGLDEAVVAGGPHPLLPHPPEILRPATAQLAAVAL